MRRQDNICDISERLISCKGNILTTNSLIIAEKFGRRHSNVLQKIETLKMSRISARLNFKVSEYKDSTGRFLPMYVIDKKSFIVLAMRFTGEKALNWQIKFVEAFEKMEILLFNKQNIPWQQSRTEGKETRTSLTDGIKKLVAIAEANGSKNANKYYTSITTMIYKEVFNLTKVPVRFRDSLSVFELHQLQLVEWKVADWLNDSIDSCFDYHEPFKEIKKKLRALVDVIGVIDLQRQLTI